MTKEVAKAINDVSTALDLANRRLDNILGERIDVNSADIIQSRATVGGLWDNTKTYEVGKYVIDNGNLFKCLMQNINTPTTDTVFWQQTDVATELNNLLALINNQ